MRMRHLCLAATLGLGCERASITTSADASLGSDSAAPAPDGQPAGDAITADGGAAPGSDASQPAAPYDAGPPPPCDREAIFRRVATRGEGVRDVSVGGVVPYRGGFVVAVHEAAPRATADGGLVRRDTVSVIAVDPDVQVQRPLELVFASAPTMTDLSVPALIPLGEGALVAFAETRGAPGSPGATLRLRVAVIDGSGAPGVPAALLEDHGEGAFTALPDGRALLLTSRLRSVGDGGVLVVSPTTYRVDAAGRVSPGQDVTSFVRLDGESLLLRPAADGAVLLSRVGDDLVQLRFDANGSVDLRGSVRTPAFGASRLDDAAVIGDLSVIAWGGAEEGMAVVRAAVVSRDGAVLARRELDRFSGDVPAVAVAPAFGGAAVAWLRGARSTVTIRATTVQPDGLVRNAPRDLVGAPFAAGRLHMRVGGGARAATFAVQDSDGQGLQGVAVGRACLP